MSDYDRSKNGRSVGDRRARPVAEPARQRWQRVDSDVSPSPARGLCRYLKISVWYSEAFQAIPIKGQARLVYLHLLTGPHTLAYHVPGLYQVGPHALQEALGLRRREFSQAIDALSETVALQVDVRKGMYWLPSALDQMGPPANPNIVRGYCRALLTMPQSPLTQLAVVAYEPFLAQLGADFVAPFRKAFPELRATDEAEGSLPAQIGLVAVSEALNTHETPEPALSAEEEPVPSHERSMQHIGSILHSLS